MELYLIAHNEEQQKLVFSPTMYQAVTVNLPGKQVIVDFQTGQVFNRDLTDQAQLMTADLVKQFKEYQKDEGLAKSTIATYGSVLNALAVFAPEWPPTPEAIDSFLKGYTKKGCSKVTLAEYWRWLNTWFNWTRTKGYIDLNPMRQVRRRKMVHVEATDIDPQDFVKVIKFLQAVIDNTHPRQRTLPYERAVRDLAIIRFTYATGCRRGEVAGLRLRDLYLDERKAIIRPETTKTKRKHPEVYFGRQAERSLRMWLEIRPDNGDQLFLGTRGNGWSPTPFTPEGVYRAWKSRQQQAKIGPYKFHEIRHSHITHSLNNGIPIHHISKQAGHRSPDITLRVYSHSQDPERKQAYDGKNPDDTLKE
jgi:integrase